ncbi:hypothetical protein BDA99DRAFT_503681 [Phascolomyces articulosus]|uniref:F-box domain-containing protein n=1 Tax=Phascolomyces articulosus TaxID=60185 RepID=A0AAD5KFU4_9FUNG|nr:hypothetical protein BDA99DRAFT_503681 [Phascolomyces articulosus]
MLPIEVLERIALHLQRHDIYHCIMVCRTWYFVFLPCLYRSTEISSDANASTIMLRHADSSLCKRMLELVLEDGMLSIQDMRKLQERCPSLKTLHFWWWRPSLLSTLFSITSPSTFLLNLEDEASVKHRLAPTRPHFFESPIPALIEFGASYHFLTRLELSCLSWEPPSIFNTPLGTDFDDWLRRLLEPMSNLSELVMNNVLPTFDVRHLYIIHTCCPNLIDFASEGPSQIHYNNNSNVAMAIVPKMQSLRLVYDGGWSDTANAWLSYIAQCYPNIVNLHLENISERSGWIRRVGSSSTNSRFLEFPQLLCAHLIRLDLDYDTVLCIQRQAPLVYDLSVHGSCRWSSVTIFESHTVLDEFDGFVSHLNDDIFRLSITIPEAYDRRLTIFYVCENLCDLSLCGNSNSNLSTTIIDSNNTMRTMIDLPVLLVTCRALRRLHLTCIHLSDELLWAPIQSPIERLELDQVTMTSDSINCIFQYCIQLSTFIAKQCYWRCISGDSVIGIQLQFGPRHFRLIQMNDQRIVWATSTYTTIWDPIQIYGLKKMVISTSSSSSPTNINSNTRCRSDRENSGDDANEFNMLRKPDRWLRVPSSRNNRSAEQKLVKRQPQFIIDTNSIFDLDSNSLNLLLETSYNDATKIDLITRHQFTTNEYTRCISERGGFMTLSYMDANHVIINGQSVQ